MAAQNSSATAPVSDRETVVTRLIAAPRELVFEAWTDPKHVAKWWGPNGFTNTIHEMDVRPGGVWRFVMHGPGGTDYQNKIVFVEIVKPERLLLSHTSGPKFELLATFTEEQGKTRVTVRQIFESAAQREQAVREFGAEVGLNQTVDRLVAHAAQMNASTSA